MTCQTEISWKDDNQKESPKIYSTEEPIERANSLLQKQPLLEKKEEEKEATQDKVKSFKQPIESEKKKRRQIPNKAEDHNSLPLLKKNKHLS